MFLNSYSMSACWLSYRIDRQHRKLTTAGADSSTRIFPDLLFGKDLARAADLYCSARCHLHAPIDSIVAGGLIQFSTCPFPTGADSPHFQTEVRTRSLQQTP